MFQAGRALESIHAGLVPELSAFGRVQLAADDRLFIGARQLSNLTAELFSIIQLCFWALAFLESGPQTTFELEGYSDSWFVW